MICFDLTLLNNGDITYSTGSINSRPIGTVATFSCTKRYILIGEINRTCGSGGWSGSAATCQGTEYYNVIWYSLLPRDSLWSFSLHWWRVSWHTLQHGCGGGEVRNTCDPGLVHSGSSVVTCLSTGNWSTLPTCQSEWTLGVANSLTSYSGHPEKDKPCWHYLAIFLLTLQYFCWHSSIAGKTPVSSKIRYRWYWWISIFQVSICPSLWHSVNIYLVYMG